MLTATVAAYQIVIWSLMVLAGSMTVVAICIGIGMTGAARIGMAAGIAEGRRRERAERNARIRRDRARAVCRRDLAAARRARDEWEVDLALWVASARLEERSDQ